MPVKAPDRAEANLAIYSLDLANPGEPKDTTAPKEREWLEPLWRQNAVWFCQLRWIVVGVLSLASLVGCMPQVLHRLGWVISPTLPLAAALILTALNLAFGRLARADDTMAPRVPVRVLLWAQIVTDLFVLTGVIHWIGHGLTAAPFMYLFHVILACVFFSPGESLAVLGLAAALYLVSEISHAFGLWNQGSGLLAEGIPPSAAPGLSRLPEFLVPTLLIWIVIWYLVSRLASKLRSRDRELFVTNYRLRASIEERTQHMLQTTHQLKAPFAAIHAQSQLLLGEYCGVLPAAAKDSVERISARCLVLARQIQEMLQLANLRSHGQTPPSRRRIELNELLEESMARVEPAARQRGVQFQKEIQPVTVEGVQDHLTMLLDNLLVNAVNYSYTNGRVQVTCCSPLSGRAIVTIRDEGIGIPKEKLPRIFDDYYRTEEAVEHNRSSTGLGLAIVRQVARKDGVPVTVESAPGWGTRFTVTVPAGPEIAFARPLNKNN